MLELGFIMESTSPLVLVPKPDGSIWFCIDFRHLNPMSSFDAFLMPTVDSVLDVIGDAQFLSTSDLTKEYWQILLALTNKEKSIFAIPTGLYHFTKMPFRLHGVEAFFQLVMDKALAAAWDCAIAHIDGILEFGPSWNQYLQLLWRVFMGLQEVRLMTNQKKSFLGQHSVQFLGFQIMQGQVRAVPDKIANLKNALHPQTKRGIQRFL